MSKGGHRGAGEIAQWCNTYSPHARLEMKKKWGEEKRDGDGRETRGEEEEEEKRVKGRMRKKKRRS